MPTLVPWKTRLSVSLRFKFFLTGVLLPIVGWLYSGGPFEPWQSGQLHDYVKFLLRAPAGYMLLPLFLYSGICLTTWCWNPTLVRSKLVRLGIYTGVPLAFIAIVLEGIIFCGEGPFFDDAISTFDKFGWFFIVLLMVLSVSSTISVCTWLLSQLVKKLKRFSIAFLFAGTATIAILITIGSHVSSKTSGDPFIVPIVSALIACVISAPVLALVTFTRVSRASIHLQSVHPKPLDKRYWIGAWIAWLTSFAIEWRFAIILMLDEYSKSPTTQPDCYICSAAAYGHRSLVRPSHAQGQGQVPVTLQMQRLKFLEFALLAASPFTHRMIRAPYNTVGPSFAQACRRWRLMADVSFLVFKPLEWLALVLQIGLRFPECSIRAIYHRKTS